jgi:DNA invertase Pin-like site-specific DNA recombinase
MLMNPSAIQRTHLERLAYVYVRQSTPVQVRQHQESTERQYQLRERARALGWAPSAVEAIDEDQGRSGSATAHRPGFQRLVTAVSLGQVGIVLMLEASRLARNNGDWYRLVELCALSGTLIADETAIYDPRDPNDRLLLGVKGTLVFVNRVWPISMLRYGPPAGLVMIVPLARGERVGAVTSLRPG